MHRKKGKSAHPSFLIVNTLSLSSSKFVSNSKATTLCTIQDVGTQHLPSIAVSNTFFVVASTNDKIYSWRCSGFLSMSAKECHLLLIFKRWRSKHLDHSGQIINWDADYSRIGVVEFHH